VPARRTTLKKRDTFLTIMVKSRGRTIRITACLGAVRKVAVDKVVSFRVNKGACHYSKIPWKIKAEAAPNVIVSRKAMSRGVIVEVRRKPDLNGRGKIGEGLGQPFDPTMVDGARS